MSINLFDRIKELSYSTGTGDFILNGAFAGFSDFASAYTYGSILYYAISDGTNYEIGSGEYLFSSPNKILRRYPFKSTNANNKVDFPAGSKEVYVTYPGQKAVFTAGSFSGVFNPQPSGLAFWRSSQILDYDASLTWDYTNNRLGINTSSPQFSIDIAGQESRLRVSGITLGASGVTFPQQDLVYSGGIQKEPFLRNQTDAITGTNNVFALSGLVSERITFKKQSPRYIFAGPVSGIVDEYPTFRPFYVDDIPDLSSLYVSQTGAGLNGQIAFYEGQRLIGYDTHLIWDKNNNYLGVNKTTPTQSLDVNGNALFSGYADIRNYISTISGIVTSGRIFFASGNLSPVGVLNWDNGEGTLAVGLKGGNINLNIGQENIVLSYNGIGNTLNKGQVVYVSGAQGQRPKVNLALADNEITASRTFGVAAESINSGSEGFIATYGVVRNINTSALNEGSGLWLSATTPGAITMTRPTAPNHGVFVGWCVRSHANAGQIFVDVQNGHELYELHDVLIQSLASGDSLIYDSSVGAWRNRASGGGSYSWTIADSGGNSESINSGAQITFSGANGIATNYNPATNIMLVSGVGAGNYSGWTVSDPFGSSESITNGASVTFSGVNGIISTYNTSNNIVSISGNYAAGSGISIIGNQISLSGNNFITSSGFAATAFVQTSGAFVTQNASFTLSNIHNGKTILSSGNSQINITVSGNLDMGFGASFIQTGAGAIYYSGAPGITIRNRQDHTRSNGTWAVSSLIQYAPNIFILAGDTTT